MATIVTGRDQIEVNGQVIAVVREPFLCGRYVRPKFRCPSCARKCCVLYLKDRVFICRWCAGYDYRSRHRFPVTAASELRRLIAEIERRYGHERADPSTGRTDAAGPDEGIPGRPASAQRAGDDRAPEGD